MTRDDIIRMAREAGFDDFFTRDLALERFATLLEKSVYENEDMFAEAYAGGYAAGAAAEREACAKVCEDGAAEFRSQKEGCRDARYDWKEDAAMECSLAIRKRMDMLGVADWR